MPEGALLPQGKVVSLQAAEYSYEDLCRQIEQLQKSYGLSVFSLGSSGFGRDIPCLVLGDADAEKKLLLTGGFWGTQAWSAQLLLKQIETYCISKGEAYKDTTIEKLFENCAVYVVPLVNPDGAELCRRGISSVPKEYRVQVEAVYRDSLLRGLLEEKAGYNAWRANGRGVDVLINFGIGTVESAQIQKQEASRGYPGEPFSSPEAAALVQLCKEQDFSAAAVYGGEGGFVDWSFGQKETFSEKCADELAALTGYTKITNGPTPEVCISVSFAQWFISYFNRPAFSFMMETENTSSAAACWEKMCLVPVLLAWQVLQGGGVEETPADEYDEIA